MKFWDSLKKEARLRAKNNRLRKENQELKKQLQRADKNNDELQEAMKIVWKNLYGIRVLKGSSWYHSIYKESVIDCGIDEEFIPDMNLSMGKEWWEEKILNKLRDFAGEFF